MLKEGDIIELKEGHRVYADIPKHFVYSNHRGNFELTHHDIVIGDQFDYLAGKYIVYKTVSDGGESGGSWRWGFDNYPNGYHVFCIKSDRTAEVDFYQTGSFAAMIEEIEPIGKAVLQWVIEEE